jgi:hypothetical protein
VALNSAPTADVTLPLTSSNPAKGTLDQTQLTFTDANWNTPQTFTISGVDNAIDDNDTAFQLVLGAMTSSDSNYAGSNPDDIAITSIDNDSSGVISGPISNQTSETGTQATFSVVLTSEPTAAVSITVDSLDKSEGTLNYASLIFTSGNWNTPQIVTVTGVDDVIDDGDVTYPIQVGPVMTTDAKYQLISPDDITNAVSQDDNDTAGFNVTLLGTLTTEAGGAASFTVRLSSRPAGNASVSMAISSFQSR